jgi:copper chaperone
MAVIEYQVTGMSCGHCEASVREEVGKIGPIEQIDVSAATGRLVVHAQDSVDDAAVIAAVIAAVDEAGYQAVRA